MARPWLWLQLALGWLPVWALYTTLLLTAHPGTPVADAAIRGVWVIGVAALLGLGVWRVTERFPWPRPFRWSFLAIHLGFAATYAVAFAVLTIGVEELHLLAFARAARDELTLHALVLLAVTWFPRFLVLGVWLYVMVAGISYATRATERAARAEALAARAQLAALRAQLNPHFLFNALHTVVHLIPREPARAAEAAEQVAGILRTTMEEDRDLVTLAEEWAFVQRYLDIERMRFGDRLRIRADLSADAESVAVPSFSVQTLVENAVRHGAGPKVEPTELTVIARTDGDSLTVTVRDTGAGCEPAAVERPTGTGLVRLRERLSALFGTRARLDLSTGNGAGFAATLTIPCEPG